MNKKKEGNLLSFKILVDHSGAIITELSGIPEKELPNFFKGLDLAVMKHIFKVAKPSLESMHKNIEEELNALNHPNPT